MSLRARLGRVALALPAAPRPHPAALISSAWQRAVAMGADAWAVLAGRGLRRYLDGTPGTAEAIGPEGLEAFLAWEAAYRSPEGHTVGEAAARLDAEGYTAALRRELRDDLRRRAIERR